MKHILTSIILSFIIITSTTAQDVIADEFDLGMGFAFPIKSAYLNLEYSLNENSGLYFNGHFEESIETKFDTIGTAPSPFPNTTSFDDKYIRLTFGYKHYFKNKKQKYFRAGWFWGTGVSYRLDLEDNPTNNLGEYRVVSLETNTGYRFVVGNRVRIQPRASFLFSGSFGDKESNNALFDLDLYLGASFSYSFTDPIKKKIEKGNRRKSKKKKRRR